MGAFLIIVSLFLKVFVFLDGFNKIIAPTFNLPTLEYWTAFGAIVTIEVLFYNPLAMVKKFSDEDYVRIAIYRYFQLGIVFGIIQIIS